jgi:hypothetical protein
VGHSIRLRIAGRVSAAPRSDRSGPGAPIAYTDEDAHRFRRDVAERTLKASLRCLPYVANNARSARRRDAHPLAIGEPWTPRLIIISQAKRRRNNDEKAKSKTGSYKRL